MPWSYIVPGHPQVRATIARSLNVAEAQVQVSIKNAQSGTAGWRRTQEMSTQMTILYSVHCDDGPSCHKLHAQASRACRQMIILWQCPVPLPPRVHARCAHARAPSPPPLQLQHNCALTIALPSHCLSPATLQLRQRSADGDGRDNAMIVAYLTPPGPMQVKALDASSVANIINSVNQARLPQPHSNPNPTLS